MVNTAGCLLGALRWACGGGEVDVRPTFSVGFVLKMQGLFNDLKKPPAFSGPSFLSNKMFIAPVLSKGWNGYH